jgi:hypothetical protein
MSGVTLWNLNMKLYKVGWDLAIEDLGLGRTCLARVTGTRPGTRIGPAKLG